MGAADALGDQGVLADGPVIEFGGSRAVELRGGLAVLHQRGEHLRAVAAGVAALEADGEPPIAAFAQAVVHLGKGRGAMDADFAAARAALVQDGSLLVCGDNAVGGAAAIARLGEQLAQEPVIVANRARGRIARFARGPLPPVAPPGSRLPLAPPSCAAAFGGAVEITARPGVFSADGLDEGTAALIGELAAWPGAPTRVLDLGCGAGHLGIAALLRWPAATAVLADADRRAVASARDNLVRLGLAERAEVRWWDAFEPAPASGVDLVLINPPFHTGVAVDFGPAKAMFRAAAAASAARSTWLIVANRRLPYEAELARHGALRLLKEAGGFKVLEVRRG